MKLINYGKDDVYTPIREYSREFSREFSPQLSPDVSRNASSFDSIKSLVVTSRENSPPFSSETILIENSSSDSSVILLS